MKVVIQRSKYAKCEVNNKIVGEIDKGLVVLVSFTDGDGLDQINYIVKKIINLRIFDDENKVMNLIHIELLESEIVNSISFLKK